MLWTLIVILFLFWAIGFAFDIAGGLIHALLVVCGILFLINLFSRKRVV